MNTPISLGNLYKLIVTADQATAQSRPGMDDFALVTSLVKKMKEHLASQEAAILEITRSVCAAGINAAKGGQIEESQAWFKLARHTSLPITSEEGKATLTSCISAAEAYAFWRQGLNDKAKENIQTALGCDNLLEEKFNWSFLIAQRSHYSSLLSRIYLSEGKVAESIDLALPGSTLFKHLPSWAEIESHNKSDNETRAFINAALRRMSGCIMITLCTHAHCQTIAEREINQRLPESSFAEPFSELTSLIKATKSDALMLEEISKGRQTTIAWYAAVFMATQRADDKSFLMAIAARMSKWPDIPKEIEQATLFNAIKA